jgi:DNA-binding FrmR family transcriptional regulator
MSSLDSTREIEVQHVCGDVLGQIRALKTSMRRLRLTLAREHRFEAALAEIEAVYRDLDTHAARNLAGAPRRRRRR